MFYRPAWKWHRLLPVHTPAAAPTELINCCVENHAVVRNRGADGCVLSWREDLKNWVRRIAAVVTFFSLKNYTVLLYCLSIPHSCSLLPAAVCCRPPAHRCHLVVVWAHCHFSWKYNWSSTKKARDSHVTHENRSTYCSNSRGLPFVKLLCVIHCSVNQQGFCRVSSSVLMFLIYPLTKHIFF